MTGSSSGELVLGQLLGGVVATLVLVAVLAVAGIIWAFRRMEILVRLETLLDARKSDLDRINERIRLANQDCVDAEDKRRNILKRTPPESMPDAPRRLTG